MATLNLSYDTGATTLSDLNDGIAADFEFTTNAQEGETKAQFSKRMVGRMIRRSYQSGKRKLGYQNVDDTLPDVTLN